MFLWKYYGYDGNHNRRQQYVCVWMLVLGHPCVYNKMRACIMTCVGLEEAHKHTLLLGPSLKRRSPEATATHR